MRMMIAILVLICCSGCVRFSEDKGVKKENAVELFYTKTPDRPYRELGLVRVSAKADNPEKTERDLRYKAYKLGADAVIVRPNVSSTTIDDGLFQNAVVVTEGVAIAWENDKPQGR